MNKTYQSIGALFLIALMPMSAFADQVSERGGGGGGFHPQQSGQHNYQSPNDNHNYNNYDNRNDNNYDNRNNQNYNNGYGGWNEGGAVVPVAPVYPAYPGYGGYLPNENPFPDQTQEDSIYRQNQHRGE